MNKTIALAMTMLVVSMAFIHFALANPEDSENKADLNEDGFVDKDDLKILFDSWGECKPTGSGTCRGDLNNDKKVDTQDMLKLLELWNSKPNPDLNTDGKVDKADLDILLNAWGTCGSSECKADLNNDKTVDIRDLWILLKHWSDKDENNGKEPKKCNPKGADFNEDGKVNANDVNAFVIAYKSNDLKRADLNCDGFVNEKDKKLFEKLYKNWQPSKAKNKLKDKEFKGKGLALGRLYNPKNPHFESLKE